MGYNYSKEWLEQRLDDVDKLLKLASTKGTITYESSVASEIQNVRFYVNNLLASIVLYYPEYRELRSLIKTWLVFDHEKDTWKLHVGHTAQNYAGRKPHSRTTAAAKYNRASLMSQQEFESVVGRPVTTSAYVHDRTIDTMDEWLRFVGHVAQASDDVLTVQCRSDVEVADLTPFRETFPTWSVEQLDRYTVRLTRTNDRSEGSRVDTLDTTNNN